MNETELRNAMRTLTIKYINDEARRATLLVQIEEHGSSCAKGVLAEIAKAPATVEETDADLIKEVAFHAV